MLCLKGVAFSKAPFLDMHVNMHVKFSPGKGGIPFHSTGSFPQSAMIIPITKGSSAGLTAQ